MNLETYKKNIEDGLAIDGGFGYTEPDDVFVRFFATPESNNISETSIQHIGERHRYINKDDIRISFLNSKTEEIAEPSHFDFYKDLMIKDVLYREWFCFYFNDLKIFSIPLMNCVGLYLPDRLDIKKASNIEKLLCKKLTSGQTETLNLENLLN